MADVSIAISFVLNLEDDKKHPGCITQLRGDSGGKTRLGIASKFHPDLVKSGFFDGDPIEGSTNPLRWTPTTVPLASGSSVAGAVYAEEYAAPLKVADIASQDVANRLLGFSVNEGQRQAVVCLQRCLPGAVVDGVIGPKTIAAVNAMDPARLIDLMKLEQEHFYSTIAATQPGLAQYAAGMKNRADA